MWIVYILSAGVSLGFSSAPQAPNAAAQPRLKAGAQRTLEGVGCAGCWPELRQQNLQDVYAHAWTSFFSPEPVSPASRAT